MKSSPTAPGTASVVAEGLRLLVGFTTLPNVNEMEKSYRAFINGEDGVAAHWIKAGTSGWRLDVADELPMPFCANCAAA